MKVSDAMSRKVVTCTPSRTLFEALQLFDTHRITGCPVVSRGRIVGVITQSDIIRLVDVHARVHKGTSPLVLAALFSEKYDFLRGAIKGVLAATVGTHMTTSVMTVDADDDVYNAAKLMNKHKIGRLPVLDSGRLTGIITKRDLVRVLGKLKK